MSVRAHAILHIGKSKISIYLVDIYREREREHCIRVQVEGLNTLHLLSLTPHECLQVS